MYLSTDLESEEIKEFEQKLQLAKGPLFLDLKDEVDFISLSSFLRCGNSLLRNYLEQITGIITGAIYPTDTTVTFALLVSGLKGEGHLGRNDTWFMKSHYPIDAPHLGAMKIRKTIVSVRNPIDVMLSYLNFKLTFSHTRSICNDFEGEFQKEWLWFLEEMHTCWDKPYTYWRKIANEGTIPVYFLRYEDLVENPKKILEDIFCFALGVESVEGTYIGKRICDITSKESNTLCRPR